MSAHRYLCVATIAFCGVMQSTAADPPADSSPAPTLQPPTTKELEEAINHGPDFSPHRVASDKLDLDILRGVGSRQLEAFLKKAVDAAPEDATAHCSLGIVYYQLGKYDDAVNELTKALAIDPKNATAHNYLGITASQKGWTEPAEKELETATRLDDEYADAHFNLALVLATETPPKKDQARKLYERALKLGADRDEALEQIVGWTPGTEDASLKTEPAPGQQDAYSKLPPELLPLARKGREEFDRGNYAAAERIYRKILKEMPDNLYTLSNLGVTLFREGKVKQSESILKKAITVAPEDGFSHCTLGIVYYQEGKYDDAVNELTKALAINPKDATAHNYLGITASQKGWQEAARKELETATKLDAGYADAHFNLAVVLATEIPPEKDRARKLYERALQLGAERDAALEQLIGRTPGPGGGAKPSEMPPVGDNVAAASRAKEVPNGAPGKTEPVPGREIAASRLPPELLPLARQGKEQFERGNYLEAEKIYRQILEKAPEDLYTLSNLGVVLFRAQKNEQAEKAFKKAIAVAPEDAFSHCTLGIVYYQEGKYDDAVNELTKALAINPKNDTAHNYLAITASQKGWDEAERQPRNARKLKPVDNRADRQFLLEGDFFTPLERERLEAGEPIW